MRMREGGEGFWIKVGGVVRVCAARPDASNIPQPSLSVLVYRIVAVILMRNQRLLGRGGGVLLTVLPRRRWGRLRHLAVGRGVRRASRGVTLLVLRLPVGIMRGIATVDGGRWCVVLHGRRCVHRVSVLWRGVVLLVTVAAERSAVRATTVTTITTIFLGRRTRRTRARGSDRFGRADWGVDRALDEAT